MLNRCPWVRDRDPRLPSLIPCGITPGCDMDHAKVVQALKKRDDVPPGPMGTEMRLAHLGQLPT
ncbi:hypothetical protein Poly41_39150 [Novipirellula artificiosorum]|uniref:Uncharacterized protein n=1 Tax=Novipirellula artificiosorum TaxID=2528016 RepID=A0A5C6DHX6_9BACT|nr:hypothetical protein Poly41_39150 [Novipirellula artificiosorum]